MKKLKILNLYAGIGGNRKTWDNCDVTAVELNEEIAEIYSLRFPNDKIIIADAHDYLLHNYKYFDFIWSSPPCTSHSIIKHCTCNHHNFKALYPDMALYQEIIFLKKYYKGLFCVENVIPYYPALIPAQKRGRHLFWTNFVLPYHLVSKNRRNEQPKIGYNETLTNWSNFHQFDFKSIKYSGNKTKIARNTIDYQEGCSIINAALYVFHRNNPKQLSIF